MLMLKATEEFSHNSSHFKKLEEIKETIYFSDLFYFLRNLNNVLKAGANIRIHKFVQSLIYK